VLRTSQKRQHVGLKFGAKSAESQKVGRCRSHFKECVEGTFHPTAPLRRLYGKWHSQPKIFWGGQKCRESKMFDFGEEQYFCLGRRFSKQKITRYAKNFGELWPPGSAYVYGSSHWEKNKERLLKNLMNLRNVQFFSLLPVQKCNFVLIDHPLERWVAFAFSNEALHHVLCLKINFLKVFKTMQITWAYIQDYNSSCWASATSLSTCNELQLSSFFSWLAFLLRQK